MPDPTSSPNNNTAVIVGAVVSAVVVLITVIVIIACILYRRIPKRESAREIGNIQNAAYDGDTQPDRRLPQVPNSESDYVEPAEYAQLDSSKRVPIDANYESLNVEGYEQLDRDPNENVQQYASLNLNGNPRNEVPDESLHEELSYVIVKT